MKILHFTDPHLSAVGPIARIDNYEETCFRKLDEIRDIAKAEGAELILCSGDFFHLKNWMRNPYSLVNKLIGYFKSLPCPVYGIIGDHDVPDRNESSVDRQPLGTLVSSGCLTLLSAGSMFNSWNKVWITGAPKTDNYEADIKNYMPDMTKHHDNLIEGRPFNGVHIHMSHGDLYVKRPVYEPYTLYSQLVGSPVDFHFNGHVHDDLGEVKVGKTTIINRGSLTRGSLVESNLNRKVTITLLDTEKRALYYRELKSALPANKIFDLDKVRETKQAEAEINRLGELIKFESGNVELSGPESIRHLVRELKTIREPVRTMIFNLLDKAEESV
ncbi:3',5'-cyclic adenosine monophosphate phosphodiesterase CpdA [uncultured archaeon]|nr:3',5'-cyclic adenosine monophosphate phosphodiesterase CpdA [uncultured archaeon]